MFTEHLMAAIDSLLSHKLRSTLTTIGIIIGVASILTVTSLGNIAASVIKDEISRLGANTLIVQVNFDNPASGPLTHVEIEALGRLPLEIILERTMFATVKSGNLNLEVTVKGKSANALIADGTLELETGRYFTKSEEAQASPVVVISQYVAEKLYKGEEAVGREIVISSQQRREYFTVIGVKKTVDGPLGSFIETQNIDIPLSSYFQLFPTEGKDIFGYLNISIDPSANVDDVTQQAISILGRIRPRDTFKTQSARGPVQLINTVTRISQFVFGGISAVSLLVGSIGILNMMLITVNERVGEIGLRKALGATKYMILNQFLLEAVILTTIGGGLGVMVSFLALNGLVLLSPFQGIYFISLSTIFLVFIGCIFLGCISGAWPAWKAARMDPIAALQHEA